MKISTLLQTLPVGCLALASAQAATVFQLGTVDNSQAEFSQELGTGAPAPGSPNTRDDDYYFAGTYPSPIGVVAVDELIGDPVDSSNASADPKGYERAVTHSNPNNRIHFNMDSADAAASTQLNLQIPLRDGGFWDGAANGGWGTHDVAITFNGVSVWSMTGITADVLVDETFSAGSVSASTGENIIEIIRTGGDNFNGSATVSNGWIQTDAVTLTSNPVPEPSSNALFLLGTLGLLARRRR
ncbi:MAG: PEP-CTERM sorting domain-containing protein [Verrucomicrobiaceae bacterium]